MADALGKDFCCLLIVLLAVLDAGLTILVSESGLASTDRTGTGRRVLDWSEPSSRMAPMEAGTRTG